jgi:Ca2+-binding RTX toxin-like protein
MPASTASPAARATTRSTVARGSIPFDGGLGNDLYFVDDLAENDRRMRAAPIPCGPRSATAWRRARESRAHGRRRGQWHGQQPCNTITGNTAANVLNGGAGTDTLLGGGGNDTIAGGSEGDALNGEAGIDTLDYSTSGAAVTVSLATNSASGGDAQGDTISGFENLVGSGFNDTLTGDGNANSLGGGTATTRSTAARATTS